MVLPGREGWLGPGLGPGEPTACHGSPFPGQENKREHADKQGSPEGHPQATQGETASVGAERELGKHLWAIWPETSPLEAALWVPEIECKLSVSAASSFTSRDISLAPLHGWDTCHAHRYKLLYRPDSSFLLSRYLEIGITGL